MEPIEGSETSAFKPQTPGKYPKENILLICLVYILWAPMKDAMYRQESQEGELMRKVMEHPYRTAVRRSYQRGTRPSFKTRRIVYTESGRPNIKQKLLVFERKMLRRIFGPTQKASGEWRLKTNEELENTINL